MYEINSRRRLWNFIATVLGGAVVGFPKEDYLEPDEQMTLEKAFDELRYGVRFALDEPCSRDGVANLNKLLDGSYAAFKAGDNQTGARLLHEFETTIFGDPDNPDIGD